MNNIKELMDAFNEQQVIEGTPELQVTDPNNTHFIYWLNQRSRFEAQGMDGLDDLEDESEYCIYCYEPKREKIGCCYENHFSTGREIKENEKQLNEIDRQMKFMHQEKQYDPPMTQTEEYLLKKQREEEHKSYDY